MERIVTIENLTKKYSDKTVVSDLSLDIPSGNIFGLIGPNGAGKSTLIGILTGLLNYEEGKITIDGMELNEANELKIKKITASVMQPPLLFEHFSAFDFMNYIADMYGIEREGRKDKICSLLDYLGMSEFEHAKIDKLSSGNRKKLAFCSAIISNPNILFLDEPFESIDVISIGRMKSILRRLKSRGKTVIITSHILEIVENLCDDIAILLDGTILAYLDAETRRNLQQESSLSEIFESYIEVEIPKHNLLDWI